MRVVIAGGHGKIALELTRLLDERGDQVRSLIRNPEHAEEVRDAGALEAIVCDLEDADDDRVAEAVGEAEAVVTGQLDGSLPDGFAQAGGVVAYEPVWAIGTGRTPTEPDIAAIHAAIRANLALWAWFARRPAAYRLATRLASGALGLLGRRAGRFSRLPLASGWTAGHDLPAPEGETFFARYARTQQEGLSGGAPPGTAA